LLKKKPANCIKTATHKRKYITLFDSCVGFKN